MSAAARARSGVRLLTIGLAVEWFTNLVSGLVYAWAIGKLRSGGALGDVGELLDITGTMSLVVGTVAMGVVLVALGKISGARLAGTYGIMLAALGLAAISMTADLVAEVQQRTREGLPPGWVQHVWKVSVFGSLSGLIALLFGLPRVARALGVTVPPAVVALGATMILWNALWWLLPLVDPRAEVLRDPDWRWVRVLVSFALRLPLLYALWRLGRSRLDALPGGRTEVPDGELGAPHLDAARWQAPLSGLETYRVAIIGKILIVVASAVLLLLAVSARSMGLVKGVAVLAPLADVIVSIVLLTGLWTYAQVPVETEARETAVMGAVLAVFQLLLQLYTLWLVFSLLSPGTSPNHERLKAAQERLPWLELFGQVIALSMLLLLLASFRSLAQYLADTALASRVVGVVVAVVVTMVAAGGLRWAIATRALRESGSILTVGLLVLIVAIAMIAIYLGLLRDLAERIKSRLRAENAFS